MAGTTKIDWTGSVILLAWLAVPGACHAADDRPNLAGVAFFEKKIRPLLVQHCYSCHSSKAEKIRGQLRLDSREAILKGGSSGPVLVPGEPESSLLLKAVRHADEAPKMPPKEKEKLTDAEIADLGAWVKM